MFQLTSEEYRALIFQTGISKVGKRGGRRHPPHVFTEHGVAMLSSVLRSERAIQVNIMIMRAFARIRRLLATHQALARKLDLLEQRLGTHDETIRDILSAIQVLMNRQDKRRRERIGFHPRR